MNKANPPKIWLRFFRWYCHPDYMEDLEGDLLERFERNTEEQGAKGARWTFTKDVIKLFRPGIIRPVEGYQKLNNYGMIKNYLKVTFRNLRRQQVTNLINITGLALGIAASFLIGLHVKQELSYESSFSQVDQVYRVSNAKWAKTSPPLKNYLQSHLPEAELVSQVAYFGNEVVSTDLYKSETPSGYYADKEFLQIFDLKTLRGNPLEAMHEPYKVVLTERMANQFYGDKNPVGELIFFDGEWDCEVIGVVENLPKNSHLKMDYFVTMPTFYKFVPEDWTSNKTWMVTYSYLKLNDQADINQTKNKIHNATYDFLSHIPKEKLDNGQQHFQMYPVKSIHLHSHREQEMGANSNISYVYIFLALALFIILIACVNFINIFTTQAIRRAKEVGVRKVLGAQKGQLVFQFLSDAFIMTVIAAILGGLFVILSLPQYNQLVLLPIQYEELLSINNLKILGVLIVTVGLFSGLYPAFFVARQRTSAILQSGKAPQSSGSLLRKVLVVFQFTVAVMMIISTAVVFLQMKYIDSKDLGFDKEQVVAVNLYGEFRTYINENWESFHAELKQQTTIEDAALASNLVGERLSVEYVVPEGVNPDSEWLSSVRVLRVDEHYLETMGISLVEGRNFLASQDTTAAYILNEKAVEMMQLKTPIGIKAENSSRDQKGTIVGVIDDYHFASLHQKVDPLVLSYSPGWTSKLLVKLNSHDIPNTLQTLEDEIKHVAPETLIDFQFIDSKVDELYKAEANMSKIVNAFSILAIIISGLGLFGLVAYTTQVRTKEIGIRKVLGASIFKIVALLTTDFTKLIAIAITIAIPTSYLLAQHWLSNFAFQLQLDWWIFGAAGLLTLIIGWLTIGFQTLKAALLNPVKCLKDE